MKYIVLLIQGVQCTYTHFFYKNQQNLRTKAFIFAIRTKIRTKEGFIFSLRNISVLNEAFSFYSLKYQYFGEDEVEFKNQKAFFKSVKNIQALMQPFQKACWLVLIKKWVYQEKTQKLFFKNQALNEVYFSNQNVVNIMKVVGSSVMSIIYLFREVKIYVSEFQIRE